MCLTFSYIFIEVDSFKKVGEAVEVSNIVPIKHHLLITVFFLEVARNYYSVKVERVDFTLLCEIMS